MTAEIDNASAIPIPDGVWRVDPERSEIGFAAKSMWGMSTVRGTFGDCHGSLTVKAQAVSGELAVDARSVDTGNGRRDRHLRSADLLDADSHPWIVFRLAAITARERGVTVAGTLRVGDNDLQLELPVEVDETQTGDVLLRATASISRAAVGVDWNWLGMIGDDTLLHAQLTLAPRCAQVTCLGPG